MTPSGIEPSTFRLVVPQRTALQPRTTMCVRSLIKVPDREYNPEPSSCGAVPQLAAPPFVWFRNNV